MVQYIYHDTLNMAGQWGSGMESVFIAKPIKSGTMTVYVTGDLNGSSLDLWMDGGVIGSYTTGANGGGLKSQGTVAIPSSLIGKTQIDLFYSHGAGIDTKYNLSPGDASAYVSDTIFTYSRMLIVFNITEDNVPTLPTLTTADKQTLINNATFTISGTALDTDSGDAMTIRYQVDGKPESLSLLANYTSNGSAYAFSKQLTFKDKRLYDGAIAVTLDLAEEVDHTLDVWVIDSIGKESAKKSVTFKVDYNTPPTVTITKKEYPTIEWVVSDVDNNIAYTTVTVNNIEKARINAPTGTQAFLLNASTLNPGDNTVVITAVDGKNASVQKTLNVNIAYASLNETQLTASGAYDDASFTVTATRPTVDTTMRVKLILGGVN